MLTRGRVLCAFCAAVMFMAAPTRADDQKDRCIAQNREAQSLRRDHKLEAARSQLRACSAAVCPALVRADCAARMEEIDRVQPTLVVEVLDASGHNVTAGTLEVDGQKLADTLDGKAIPLDPGDHSLVIHPANADTVTRTLVLREGESGRERVVLAAKPPAKEASVASGSPPWSTIGLVAAGAGAVSLGIGTYFAFDAKSKNDASNSSGCHGDNCTASAADTRRAALSSAGVSTVTMAIGAALVLGGVTLWYFAPRRDVGVAIAPTALAGGGGLSAWGSWR